MNIKYSIQNSRFNEFHDDSMTNGRLQSLSTLRETLPATMGV